MHGENLAVQAHPGDGGRAIEICKSARLISYEETCRERGQLASASGFPDSFGTGGRHANEIDRVR